MPDLNLIFQGKTENINHLDIFRKMVTSSENIEKIIISSAFVRSEGVQLLDSIIKNLYERTAIYLGIRNGITSIQSLFSLMHKNIETYAIDTASPAILYHPKIFGVKSSTNISLLIGSANLTSGGLLRNIEASFHYRDIISDSSLNIWNQYEESLRFLRDDCSENVTKVESYRDSYEMFLDGLLIDERIISRPRVEGTKKGKSTRIKKAIKLNTKKVYTDRKNKKKKTVREINRDFSRSGWVLLWEIFPLTERDLNIPSGNNTHSTGDMNFKKGLLENIDQRHYFRDEIFNNLDWTQDSQKTHLERAFANFQIIIKGVNNGLYEIKLTHNTDTDSPTYKQNNCMTKMSWGNAKPLISKRELLECSLKMFKPQRNDDFFILEFI